MLCAWIGLAAAPSWAQGQTTRPDLSPEDRREALFEALQAAPTDVDLLLAYAEASMALDDPEGAIIALERLLILSPDQPEVKLTLGRLYERLGAYDTARAFFSDAAEDETFRTEANQEIARIDARTAVHRVAGAVTLGVRAQTNATFAPSGRSVTIGGIQIDLDPDQREQADVNAFALGQIVYQYDLQNQGDSIEATLDLYGAVFASERDLDSQYVNATLGPRFHLTRRGLPGASLRPFVSATHVRLDRQTYLRAAGAGVTLDVPATALGSLRAELAAQRRAFSATTASPANPERDGWRLSARLGTRVPLSPRTGLDLEATFDRATADAAYEESLSAGASAALVFQLPVRLSDDAGEWQLAVGAGYRREVFEAPNPAISTRRRADDEITARAGLVVPVSQTLSLLVQADYQDRRSTYDVEEFDNLAGMVAITWRF
ncbi:MAG: tetratricopeptide repeat protein [Alphaproteobacteria bacterium]|nr:tetratricopeptide repeat protein [Alphaproteobacteria bacterium]MDX5369064.1 tetratricopeptide repeat protein [Alphaproteobacteria bacterium]MDX5463768.1 tetratricopeptide repeat protein [Alphaproteobacteria bacterium]